MQSPHLFITSAYDRQQVIYIFDKMCVKVNTQESRVKNVIPGILLEGAMC